MNYHARRLKDGTIYQKKNIYIKYYTKEQFKKYQATADIIGEIELKNKEKLSTKDVVIVQNENSISQFELKQLNPKHKVLGYIYIQDNKFVKITKIKNFNILMVLIPILIFFTILFCLFHFKSDKNNDIESSTENIKIENLSKEKIKIPLYESFDLNKENNTIELINPKENNVNFKYEIYKDDELIFETKEIEPNGSETFNVLNYLDEGEYTLYFKIKCFDDIEEVNGTNEPVVVKINIE